VERDPETPEVVQEGGAAEEAAPAPAPDARDAPDASADGAAGQEVEQDLAELQARASERDEFLALAQRTQADFENFRRRAAREQGLAEQRGVAKVVRELLPALDNLERALAAAEAQPDGTEHHLAEGIRLVQAELLAAMGRVGVEGYSPKGEPFDPNVHEAMAQQPVEGAESGTVVEVYQQGYRIQGDVIRPARVIVAA
jgi:molecular chaperone GrpE